MTTPDHQRWLDAAARYVRLRDELILKQREIDAAKKILAACVPVGGEPLALLLRNSSVVVLVAHPFNKDLKIEVRPVIR